MNTLCHAVADPPPLADNIERITGEHRLNLTDCRYPDVAMMGSKDSNGTEHLQCENAKALL